MVRPRFLLDTNILSEPLRPRPSPRALAKLDEHHGELATAAVVIHEMAYGLAKLPPSRRKDGIRDYLEEMIHSGVTVLPYDLEAALWHAEERARLEKQGRATSFRDVQIAATAHVHRLVLVTGNVKDFQGLEGLEVENWL
ncbi:MAG TPA: type II toxin-antitoxin system VapC family toxin [Thermoanaerobaculia bacterium]|nr:type II toxin-antitoxin system VapC family toxin [Thermoanaerobaculia bacterium]